MKGQLIAIIFVSLILNSCNSQNQNTMKIINGEGNLEEIKNPELKILSKFYKAFNEGDMPLMKQVWLNSNEASMNNPLGGIMRSWKEIESVYNKIFNGDAKVYVEFYDFTIHKTDNMFFATGRERGYFKTDSIEIPLKIRTSRVFIKTDGEWKQIQHHGSIDDVELLKSYQESVR